jgi:hypothetical protein
MRSVMEAIATPAMIGGTFRLGDHVATLKF